MQASPDFRRANGRGFRYVERDLTPDGIAQLVWQSGADGKAQIGLEGEGAAAPDSDAADRRPGGARAAGGSGGACFEATYATSFRDGGQQFEARAD